MSAIDSISVGVDALKRNLVPLYVVGAIIAVGGGLVVGLQHFPRLGLLLALGVGAIWLFAEPFVSGGYLAMLDEAIDGETDYDTLAEEGKENYLNLLIGRILVLGAEYALWALVGVAIFVMLIVFFGAAIGAAAAEEATAVLAASTLFLVAIPVLVVFAWLLTIIVGFFIQFYAVAIVLEDENFAQGFVRSAGVVKNNPLSVLGYSLVVWVIQLLVAIPVGIGWMLQDFGRDVVYALLTDDATGTGEEPFGGEPTGGTPTGDGAAGTGGDGALEALLLAEGFGFGIFLVILVVLFLLRALTIPILRAYHVAFYRSITDRAG